MAHSVVIQWNCRSISSKKSDLYHIIKKFDPFAVSLQETWLKPEYNFKVSGYSCLREDRTDGYGGVALLVKHSVLVSHIPIQDHSPDFSIIAASVNNICFVSLYIPHPNSSIFNELQSIFASLPSPVLIMGDFNAQHLSWGSSSSNYYGSKILDIIDQTNLCILNNGNCTRRTAPGEGISVPDLSLCSPNLASSLRWSTLDSSYGSDHFPIFITFPSVIGKKSFSNRPPRLKYRLTNVDWSLYSEKVQGKILALPAVAETNVFECNQSFSHILIETADEIFPVKSCRLKNFPSPPWWDEECSNAIRKRKAAELRYKAFSSVENFDALSELIHSTRRLFKKKKWEGWKKFCAQISPEVSPSLVWSNIRRYRSSYKESSPTFIPKLTADQFLDKIAPPYVPQNYLSYSSFPLSEEHSKFSRPFNLNEIKSVISYVKDSSPGIDGIPYSFISHLSNSSLEYFLNLINTIMYSGHVPPSWKSQEVIPILKPNCSPSLASSYRPIALSSVLTKISEHLIKNRLEWLLESKGLLSNSQYGFRKGKSTMDSIGIFTTDIHLAFTDNKSLLAAFLDISAAYDNVDLYILRNKLLDLNIPHTLVNFVINMLLERSIHINVDNSTTISRTTWKGLPQGSVLSPLLYNVYTHDLESSVKTTNIEVLQYADDLLIYSTGHSIDSLSISLTKSLKCLQLWLDNNNLNLSVSKSSVIHFTRRRIPSPVSVLYDGIPIPVVKEVKFLGIILDSKFSGLPHFYYISGKCERTLNILRCLAGVWWGAHPFSLKLLYNSLIRSVIDYGSFFLESCSVVGLKKLDSIQSKALRIISGAMKSSPINALQVECVEPPLRLRRQLLSDRFLFRAFQIFNHPLFNKLQFLSRCMERSHYWLHKSIPCPIISFRKFQSIQAPIHKSTYLPIFCSDFDSLILNPIVSYNKDLQKRDPIASYNFDYILNTDFFDWHHIYCDASKLSPTGCVGVGVFHQQFKIVQKVKLPPESSVFTGECFGILRSLEYILLTKLKKTVIFSDSKSALQALERSPFKKKNNLTLIFKCRDLLLKCKEFGLFIQFMWLPSHHNISGNEQADKLAKEAIFCGDIFPYINFSYDLLAKSNLDLRRAWEIDWNNSSLRKGKTYKAIQLHIPTKPWFSIMNLGKMATSNMIRMRLGHTCTPAHLARLNILTSSTCVCGDDIGDINHILFDCPLHDRSSFLSSLISLRVPFPSCANTLLASNNFDIYKIIALYLSINNIKI